MNRRLSLAGPIFVLLLVLAAAEVSRLVSLVAAIQTAAPAAPAPVILVGPVRTITDADCTVGKVGESIPPTAIGEPVSGVTLSAPRWVAAAGDTAAHCLVEGAIRAIDSAAPAINFRVALPAAWRQRSVQVGGAGMNGFIPNVTSAFGFDRGPSPLQRGFTVYGSDSGHSSAPPGRGGAPSSSDWTLNDEAIRNLGYMQMKKTHDAAVALMERLYGERPRFNYYVGTSQGGREALTVAQRYPRDYDGIIANVPIVSFSSLMLAPELIRIQEKPNANWVTPAKVNAIRGEVIRQCDHLDGLADGVVNHYMACREMFDMTQGSSNRNPWAAKRCPNNVDPNPADTSAAACLTDGQMATLRMVYSPYRFATPLANGVRAFGMWTPNTDPSGSGLILGQRFRGQEGADANAPMHTHLGVLGVTGFLMRDLSANPLDYVEGGPLNARRLQLSEWLDSANPDLSAFAGRGGKAILTIGTNDTLASPGAQLAYYQSLFDKMGRTAVDSFARLFVIPQADHGLRGNNYGTNGKGETIPVAPLATQYDRFDRLIDWVENNSAPAKQLSVSGGDRTLPLCSYPAFPKYVSGPAASAASYTCAER